MLGVCTVYARFMLDPFMTPIYARFMSNVCKIRVLVHKKQNLHKNMQQLYSNVKRQTSHSINAKQLELKHIVTTLENDER